MATDGTQGLKVTYFQWHFFIDGGGRSATVKLLFATVTEV